MNEAKVPALPYELAPSGAPDRFRLTRDTLFHWTDPPGWAWDMVKAPVQTVDGAIWRELSPEGRRRISLLANKGFHFAVTCAPDLPRALAGLIAGFLAGRVGKQK